MTALDRWCHISRWYLVHLMDLGWLRRLLERVFPAPTPEPVPVPVRVRRRLD